MTKSIIETIAKRDGCLLPYLKTLSLNKVNTLKKVGDITYSIHTDISGIKEEINIMFDSLKKSLKYMLPALTNSEIESIDSMVQLYLKAFPYFVTVSNPTESNFTISINKQETECDFKFKYFYISESQGQWYIHLINEPLDFIFLDDISFKSIQKALLKSFKNSFIKIYGKNVNIDNYLFKEVIENQTAFCLNSILFKNILTYESEIDFISNIKKTNKFKICEGIKNKNIENDIIYVDGNSNSIKDIINLASNYDIKLKFNRDSIYFVDDLLNTVLTPDNLLYLHKILNLMQIADNCFHSEKNNIIKFIRDNKEKGVIKHSIIYKDLYHIENGKHIIDISNHIRISIDVSEKILHVAGVNSFKKAYEQIYQSFTSHVANKLNIDNVAEITEEHFKFLEMSNY